MLIDDEAAHADVLILATGFRATKLLNSYNMIGGRRRDLSDS